MYKFDPSASQGVASEITGTSTWIEYYPVTTTFETTFTTMGTDGLDMMVTDTFVLVE